MSLFTQIPYTLQTLIANIDSGILALPEIQRPFVWENAKVRDLFDSMYRGYPVGTLLFWLTSNNTQAGRTIGQKPDRSSQPYRRWTTAFDRLVCRHQGRACTAQ